MWLAYAGSSALAVWLARRFVSSIPARTALLIALLPLVFTGEAMLLGKLYGPADLYETADPWKSLGPTQAASAPKNPILSDLAFANLPWRAAVRQSLAEGRLPLWNRFVLAGNPLLGTAQAGVLHPATWIAVWLPVPLSWTFSCAFTLFLGLLSGYLFFRDFDLGERAALTGAVGWGFSTYLLFWDGWSVGPSTATFPLLLLGLRRLAREPGRRAIGLTAAALWLSFCGGHPESFFHCVAAGAVYFAWELFRRRGPAAARAIGAALAAGALALLLAGPQLFPLLEAIPNSAEYRLRREAVARGSARQAVPLPEAARRLLPDLLPFAHGICGKSPVQAGRDDGSGMPLGYAGAVLFPLALLAVTDPRPRTRGRSIFLAFLVAGFAYGASFPGVLDATSRLPGFALALNHRLVFLAGLGLAGLAALGVERLETQGGAVRDLGRAAAVCAAVILGAFLLALPVLRARGLSPGFAGAGLAYQLTPLILLALAGRTRSPAPRLAAAALALLVAQRFFEMRGTYPTLPTSALVPPLPTLAAIPPGSEPRRVVATGELLRPNGAALYQLEDVRGYESLVLDRFADTYPLWCEAQQASFNRVGDLSRPFLGFLNARYAIGAPGDAAPPGWREQARGPEMTIFENPRALPRAFVPTRLRREADAARRLEAMARETDFAETAWISGAGAPVEENGRAALRLRAVGSDLVISAEASHRAFVATSLPDWPGWVAEAGNRELPLATVNHAFVGFWLDPGRHTVRLSYRPGSWSLGVAAGGLGAAAALVLATARRRRS